MIAGRLPGRTDNEVKNYWNSHLKKKLMRMGIDPNNHRLGGRAPGSSNLLMSAAADNKAVMDSTSGSASKTVSSLPDLNLNLISMEAPISVDDQEMRLLSEANSDKKLETAPCTTLLLFG